GRFESENLVVAADGLGDLGKRTLGPKGLQLSAQTAALSRITGGPAMGPARIAGVLTQAPAGWKFAGQGSVERAGLGAYQLARAAGPVEFSYGKGDLGLNIRLAGAGGQGAGFIGAALGAAPKAAFEGVRLADGRLELRKLEVDGAGLKAQASGGR